MHTQTMHTQTMHTQTMHDALPVRKEFDICAPSEPQLELRLHWFGRALAVRRGYIVHVKRGRSHAGHHVASVAYEMPLPQFGRARPPLGARQADGASRSKRRQVSRIRRVVL